MHAGHTLIFLFCARLAFNSQAIFLVNKRIKQETILYMFFLYPEYSKINQYK